jgi:hypothetical protein
VCRYWIDSSFDGTSKQRLVNQVLVNLVHFHFPRVVRLSSGRWELTTTWKHNRFASDGDYETTQGAMSHDFCISIFSMHGFLFVTLVY